MPAIACCGNRSPVSHSGAVEYDGVVKIPLFPASVVGSLPRPEYVRRLLGDEALRPDERDRLLDHAIGAAVAMQETAGLDVVTDGEWRRKSYIGVIADMARGFELGSFPDGRPYTVVVDRLEPKVAGVVAKEVRFLKRVTSKAIKATLPAPALLGERLWEPSKSVAAYPDREDFVRACVPILRQELAALVEEGVAIVQIDDPHLCLFVDDAVRAQYADPEAAADFAVETTNAVVEGFGDAVKLAVHLCRRAGARARGEAAFHGGYERIVDRLNRLAVHHLTMEFTDPAAGDMAVFRQLRPDLEIGLGCVGTTPGVVDSVTTIVDRARRALEHLDPSRLTLNPDCGFAPGSGAVVDLDEVFRKLCNEAEAARRLRAEFGS